MAHDAISTVTRRGLRLAEEESFRVLFDASPIPKAVFDRRGRIRRVNRPLVELLGLPPSRLLDRPVLELVVPEDRRPTTRATIEAFDRKATFFHLEMRLVRGGPSTFHAQVTVSVHRDATGCADLLVAQVLDVSDRVARAAVLEERNRVLELIAGGAPAPEVYRAVARLAERSLPGVRAAILLADEEAHALRCVAAPSLPGWFVTELHGVPIDIDGGSCGRTAALGERTVTAALADRPMWRAHAAALATAGLQSCWSEPIPGSDGACLGALALFGGRDRASGTLDLDLDVVVTATNLARVAVERARTLDALAASEEQYRRIFESTTDGLLVLTPEGKVADANPAACAMHGRSPEEFLRLRPEDFVAPESRHHFERFRSLLSRGREYRCEAVDLRADGSRFPVEVWGVPFRFRGQRHLLGVLRDITDRRAAEDQLSQRARELERRNRDLEEFAMIASHDLQEPLRKILAFGERMRETQAERLDERGQQYLDRIVDSAGWARTLVRDLRRWSRAAASREPLERVALDEVVAGAVCDLSELIRETGAVVDVGALPAVLGDAVQLRQLFLNLVGNALKFRRDGATVRVRIAAEDPPAEIDGDPGPWCRLRIEDNGIGFDPEYSDRIFGVFERLHGRERYSGTGMGLAIVRRIVERHDGKVTATGAPGKGSRFRLDLRAAS